VDVYLALTDFVRQKLIDGGFPAGKIEVKGNFVNPDPGAGDGAGGYAIFVGRLSREKGISTLLSAWESAGDLPPLRIVGDGPQAEAVRNAAKRCPRIQWIGRRPMEEVLNLVGAASMLVFPSEWYEGQPKVLLESFAKGTPVLASRLGSMIELVDDRNGMLFNPGDADDLGRTARLLLSDAAGLLQKRQAARQRFETQFTADRNYESLLAVYRKALSTRGSAAAIPCEPAYPQN
jgi:glycosyltransferase involved in cell wall biosynthesis